MIQVKAPGKLYIAGEYAVTEPGYKSVLIAVNRFVTASIELDQPKCLYIGFCISEENREGYTMKTEPINFSEIFQSIVTG